MINNCDNNCCDIELDNEITKEGFYALETYYSGGIIEINENNCLNILKICIIYDEIDLMKKCEKYIINNMKKNIIENIIEDKLILNCHELKILREYEVNYLINNLFKHINTIKILPLVTLQDIINNNQFKIDNDKLYQLVGLLKYCKENKYEYDKREINKLLYRIHNRTLYKYDDVKENEFILNERKNSTIYKMKEFEQNYISGIKKSKIKYEMMLNLFIYNKIRIKNDIIDRINNLNVDNIDNIFKIIYYIWLFKEKELFNYFKTIQNQEDFDYVNSIKNQIVFDVFQFTNPGKNESIINKINPNDYKLDLSCIIINN